METSVCVRSEDGEGLDTGYSGGGVCGGGSSCTAE